MPAVQSALVVGAGIGGLAAAAALATEGIDTDIIEIRPEANVYGVGINQPANSLRALRKLGVLDRIAAAGFAFDRYTFYDYKNREIVDVPSAIGGDDVPHNIAVSRRDLHEALISAVEATGLRVRYGTTADQVVDGPDGVDVTFSDGTSKRYDVVAAFDGIKSPLRRQLFGTSYDPVYTGYGVCRVTMPRPPEMTFSTVYQGINTKVGCIPLSQQDMYLFMVTPEPQDARFTQEQLRELMRERLADFEGPPAVVRDALSEEHEVVYGALNEVMLPAPWHRGRIVIAGDAAHACSPHITQGAAMAIEDGVVLAEELRADRPLEDALTAFSARRAPRAQFVQTVSRAILDAEMQVTSEEALGHAVEHMRAELVGQNAGVDAFLKQPA